jgi:hypothetical protein
MADGRWQMADSLWLIADSYMEEVEDGVSV